MFGILVFTTDDPKLIEYSLHCLTTIFKHPFAPKNIIFSDPAFVPRLLTLMHESVLNQICVATVLSNACTVSYINVT
jgi:hypothetical protein